MTEIIARNTAQLPRLISNNEQAAAWQSLPASEIAISLDGCTAEARTVRCQNAFRNLEIYTSGMNDAAVMKRWDAQLAKSNDWNTARLTYLSAETTDQKLVALDMMVRAAFAQTDLPSHNVLLKSTWGAVDDYADPAFAVSAPVEFNDVTRRIELERVLGRTWIESHIQNVVSQETSGSSGELSVEALNVFAETLDALHAPVLARHYYDQAAQVAKERHHNEAMELWYELRSFETYSSEDKVAHKAKLDAIRSRIPGLISRAKETARIPAFDHPMIAHFPNSLRGADAATIESYPTVVYNAQATRSGIEPTTIAEVKNAATVSMSKLGQKAIDELVVENDWTALLGVVTSPWEDLDNESMQVVTKEPIVIYQPETSQINRDTSTYEQARTVEELAWRSAYQLAHDDVNEAKQLEFVFTERVYNLGASTVSADESTLVAQNARLILNRRLGRGGEVEHILTEENSAAAEAHIQKNILPVVHRIESLGRAHINNDPQNPTANAVANLVWSAEWDARVLSDQPNKAISSVVNSVLPTYGKFAAVQNHMQRLRSDYSWLFNAKAELDPTIDVTDLPEGQRAALRASSRYWAGNSEVAAMGFPTAGAIVGGGLGAWAAAAVCTAGIPFCAGALMVVGGSVGGSAGYGANRQWNEYQHDDDIANAARTGISIINDEEYEMRNTQWHKGLFLTAAVSAPLGMIGAPLPGMVGYAVEGVGAAVRGGGVRALISSTAESAIAPDLWSSLGSGVSHSWGSFWRGIRSPGSKMRLGIAGIGGIVDLATDENYALNPDFKINNLWGWSAGALIFNETVGTYVLGVNANGQVVSLVMNTGGEVLMQGLQDRKISKPDGWRCFVSNIFSNVATGLVRKPVLLGDRHFRGFAVGREIIMPIRDQFPKLTYALRPVAEREGAVRTWMSPTIHINEGQYRKILGGITADEMMAAYPGRFSGKWMAPSETTKYRFTLRDPLTRSEFEALGVTEKSRWVEVPLTNGETGYQLLRGSISAKNWLSIHGVKDWRWQRGVGTEVGRMRITANTDPASLPDSIQLNPMVGRWESIVDEAGATQYVWHSPRIDPATFTIVESELAVAGVGKWSPQLTFRGMGQYFLGPYLGGLAVVNSIAGSRAQEADSYFFPANRVLDYGFGAIVTEPFMKTPLGIDTPQAQFVGYAMAISTRVVLNYFLPTYSEQWVGEKYMDSLDEARTNDAFAIASRNMRTITTPLSPMWDGVLGDSGPVEGTMWRLEYRALKTLRDKHDVMFNNVLSNRVLGTGAMNERKRNERLLRTFNTMVDAQLARFGSQDLDLDEGRLAVVLAAYIKCKVAAANPKAKPNILMPFKEMMARYPKVFDALPSHLQSDYAWHQWIQNVNKGQYDGLFVSTIH